MLPIALSHDLASHPLVIAGPMPSKWRPGRGIKEVLDELELSDTHGKLLRNQLLIYIDVITTISHKLSKTTTMAFHLIIVRNSSTVMAKSISVLVEQSGLGHITSRIS